MAYAITNETINGVVGNKSQVTIIMESESDVSSLPTTFAAGSVAIIADEGLPVYMLGVDGVWHAA